MIRKTKIGILLLIISFFVISIYAKTKIHNIDYTNYINEGRYFTISEKECYSHFPKLKDLFIPKDKIASAEDLINESDYVLEISAKEQPIFYGNGIINEVKINKIFKQPLDEKLKIGDNIKVYDSIYSWSISGTDYFGGMTPIKVGETYLFFLKKAPEPNLKDTYIYASINFGHFNVKNDIEVLTNYNQGTLSIKEAMEYDHIYTYYDNVPADEVEKEIVTFKELKTQFLNIYSY